MGTRFYYDDNNYWDGGTSNPATPAYYSGWHETNTALRTSLKLGRPGNAFSQSTIEKAVSGAPKYGLARVYVSDPLPTAFTLTGTVRGQMFVQEQNAANDAMRAVVIRIWNSTTNAFRTPATLVHFPVVIASEFNAIGAQNRFFPPEVPVVPVNVLKNDRIVVEIGGAYFSTGVAPGNTLTFRNGNPAGSTDLPEDESYTVPEAAAWIEFSMQFPVGVPARSPSFPGGGAFAPIGGLDYLFELTAPDGTRYDVTDRAAIEGLGTLNLVVERNLHDFRSGDLTVTFDDGDGFFTDLFANIQATDRWRLAVDRDHLRRFTGAIPGIDSIRFDRKQKTVEVTALDLSKLLEDLASDPVSRPVDIYFLAADVAISATSLTLNSTAGLYNGDTLSLVSDATQEEATIALVTSATVVQLAQPMANAFVALDTTATLTTPFYRFKTPEFLINALLDAGSTVISGRSIRLSSLTSRVPLFSDMSTNRLGATAVPNAFTQKGAKHFSRVGSASFEQTTPDADWTSVSPDRQWMDWSPYRTQAQGEPATFATLASGIVALGGNVDNVAIDYTVGAFVEYYLQAVGYGGPNPYIAVEIWKWTSSDGFTWSGSSLVTDVARVQLALPPAFYPVEMTCDLDSSRNRIYFYWNRANGFGGFGYYDLGSSTQVDLHSGGKLTNGLRYSREYDGLVVYNATQNTIEIWRDSSVVLSYSGPLAGSWLPPYTRYFNGAWYSVAYPQAVPSIFFSSDALGTVTQISLASKTTGATDRRITIVNGTVRVAVNAPLVPGGVSTARYFVGAATFAGTIAYADFSGQSIINALDDLAILLNGVFSVDVDGVAHFIVRELDSGAEPKDIDDLVVERQDDPIWLELYNYVEFNLPDGSVASAGQKTSTSRNLSISSQLVTSFSVAASAALYLLDFFSKPRRHVSAHLYEDGTVYSLLDPIRLDGTDWIVYAMTVDLAAYELDIELIEKV